MQTKKVTEGGLVHALKQFQAQFACKPEKLVLPMDFALIVASKQLFDCPLISTHLYFCKFVHKLAHRFGLRTRRHI